MDDYWSFRLGDLQILRIYPQQFIYVAVNHFSRLDQNNSEYFIAFWRIIIAFGDHQTAK